MQKYTQLTYEQRYHIYLLNKQVYNQTFIAKSKGVGVTIESYGKVEISYINVDNFYMDNDRDIQFDIVIGHH